MHDVFSASTETILWFLSCLLFMWCITLIDLHMLNHPCETGMNPTWLWCMIFFYIVGFRLLIFCCGFLHLYSSKILACNFLFLLVPLSGFGIRVMVASQNVFGSVPSSSVFWKSLRTWYLQRILDGTRTSALYLIVILMYIRKTDFHPMPARILLPRGKKSNMIIFK